MLDQESVLDGREVDHQTLMVGQEGVLVVVD